MLSEHKKGRTLFFFHLFSVFFNTLLTDDISKHRTKVLGNGLKGKIISDMARGEWWQKRARAPLSEGRAAARILVGFAVIIITIV
ncbi:hypothetical protein C9I90_22645 [Photobacterium aphoticum]|uniref:Uncharacterized protein n=1 Tax=Photobacterium aphoticum TaxID=754436 RepID=A0A0J1GP12_9GAMM|nr:hypothetical protein ABT58_08115 [Photobacterium aphoticum]PSU48978.1 hypothetical protein C9I90_22645 [Photobacterium aphoticum]